MRRISACPKALTIIIIFILLAVIAGCGSAPSAQKDTSENNASDNEITEKDTSEKKPKKQDNKQSQQKDTGTIGDTVKVGDASWSVRDAWRTTEIPNTYGGSLPPKKGNFVVVYFLYKNRGNEAKTLHHGALQLIDSAGRKSDPDTDTFGYIPNDKDIFLQQVNPGVVEDGQVIFSVDPKGSGYKLLIKDTNLFRSETNQAEVDLGF